MARPKGVKNSTRNPEKYWLPDKVTLKPGQTEYVQATMLTFIDEVYGEFTSSFKALQDANASTHPKAVQERREATNKVKYGGTNPSHSPAVRRKAEDTMLKKFGVSHALQNDENLAKARDTLNKNHGVAHPGQVESGKQYGDKNAMRDPAVKDKIRRTSMDKFGVPNAMQNAEVKERFFKSMAENGFISSGQQEVMDYISSLGLTPYQGYFGGANPKQIDIKIKESNVCIEYNGAIWHCTGNGIVTDKYHLEKTQLAEQNGKRLIHIFDFEWLDRQQQVKSYLRSALGKNSRIIYARKTEIREVPKADARDFLEKYHILGQVWHKKAFGLYLDQELLCLITVASHHRGTGEMMLNRYVGKEDVSVVGGLSKLCKAAVKEYGEIKTFVDKRFSDGTNWVKAGWEVISVGRPDYFYYNPQKHEVISKISRRKAAVKTPEGMTEWEHAKLDGLERIYDCGKIKLRYKG